MEQCNFAAWDDEIADYRQCPNGGGRVLGEFDTVLLHDMMAEIADEPDYDLWITHEQAVLCEDHYLPVMTDVKVWLEERETI